MIRSVDIKKNHILYPIQYFMGMFVHLGLILIKPITPKRYKSKLAEIEGNAFVMNVLGLTFFNAIGGLLVMITNVKLANVLGASLFGVYSYYIAIGEVGSIFVRYGRHKTMTRDLIQNPNLFDSLISNTFILGLLNIFVFILLITIFSNPLDIEITIASVLLMLSPCIGCVDFQPVYESIKLISWHAIYHLIQKIVFFSGIWCGIMSISHPSLLYVSIVLFVSWFITIVIQYWEIIIGLNIKIKDYVSLKTIVGLYKSNFLISLGCLAGVAFGPVIQMVLKDRADSSSVGIYAAGMQIFLLCQFFFNQIARVGNPMMAEAGKETCSISQRKLLVKRYTIIMLAAAIPFLLPLVVFPQLTADLFFTSEYAELGSLLPWFGLYLVGLAIGIVYTQFLISMRRDKEYFAIYITSALLTLVCTFTLIPIWGVLGAVIALCVPHTIGCVFYFIFSVKYLR